MDIGNRIGDEGAHAIMSALETNSTLKTLNLQSTKDAGRIYLESHYFDRFYF